MNRIIALLVIAQFICLSQSAQTKRASDACPGVNNKSNTSKDYAYLSKRTSGDSDFSKPKYQSIYAKNTNVNTPIKRGRTIANNEQATTSTPVRNVGKRENATSILKEEKNKTSKTTREPEVEDEFIEPTLSEGKVQNSKPMDVIQTEKVVVPEAKKETYFEEGKIASSKKSEKATLKIASTKSSDLKTTKATKQKQQKKSTHKKLRLGKKCATDCPEF